MINATILVRVAVMVLVVRVVSSIGLRRRVIICVMLVLRGVRPVIMILVV